MVTRVPNRATPEHFVALRPHFRDEQIVELVGVSALFGLAQPVDDTMATALEADPLTWARGRILVRADGSRGSTAAEAGWLIRGDILRSLDAPRARSAARSRRAASGRASPGESAMERVGRGIEPRGRS